jgi:hypothetical protein
MSNDQETREPWTARRIRHRLTTLIDALPMAEGRDQHSRELLKNVRDDLIEVRAGLDQLFGDYK